MLARLKLDINVNELLDQIHQSVWTSDTTTFFDPAIGGGQFVRAIEQRLRACGHSDANIYSRVVGLEENVLRRDYAVYKYKLVGNYGAEHFLEKDFKDMKFDVIVGNPPFQDGSMKSVNGKTNTQNKIYYKIAKKCMTLLKGNGIIAMLTPASVTENNKKFSILSRAGLKNVNFSAGAHFNVGVNIVSWIIDKTYIGPVTIIGSDKSTRVISAPKIIFDPDSVDLNFIEIYLACKEQCSTLNNRMFARNNVGNIRSFEKTDEYYYATYKKENNSDILLYYAKRKPYYYKKQKLIIPTTKTFKEENSFISVDTDYDMNYLNVEITDNDQINNIKSFIFSEYYIKFSSDWKGFKGVGFIESLVYLPIFDKTKSWTSEEVQEFLEGFVSAQ